MKKKCKTDPLFLIISEESRFNQFYFIFLVDFPFSHAFQSNKCENARMIDNPLGLQRNTLHYLRKRSNDR